MILTYGIFGYYLFWLSLNDIHQDETWAMILIRSALYLTIGPILWAGVMLAGLLVSLEKH